MTGIALCRMPLRALARSKLMRWALGGNDRGGQDKNRKVRAVGSVRDSAKFRFVSNIANDFRTLLFLTMRYRSSAFYTLWGSR
jgi:hypothetical protein